MNMDGAAWLKYFTGSQSQIFAVSGHRMKSMAAEEHDGYNRSDGDINNDRRFAGSLKFYR